MSHNIYSQIFYSTTKYVLLRNFFMVITGVISIFIVRLLGPQEYGKYSLVWQLISTVGPILSLGWLTTLAKFVPEKVNNEEKSKLFSQSLASVLIVGVMFFLIINLSVKFFPQIFPVEIKEIVLIFSLFNIFVAFFNIFEGFWRGLGKFNEFVIIDGLRSNIGNILGLGLVIYGFISYTTIIRSNFFVSIAFLVFLFFSVKKYILYNFGNFDRQVIIFCLSLLFGQVAYMLSTNLDLLMLRGILKDPQQVGYYTAGIRIPRMIETMFISQLPAPMLYYFNSTQTSYLKEKILSFGCKILGFLFGAISVVCFTFADYVIPFLFGDKFVYSVNVFRFFSLSLPILAILILISPFYASQNKPYVYIIIHFFIMVLLYNLMNMFLIPKYKFFAPVISYLVALVIFATIISIDCYRRYKLNLLRGLTTLVVFLSFSIILEKMINIPILSFLTFVFSYFLSKTISIKDLITFKSMLMKEKIDENT